MVQGQSGGKIHAEVRIDDDAESVLDRVGGDGFTSALEISDAAAYVWYLTLVPHTHYTKFVCAFLMLIRLNTGGHIFTLSQRQCNILYCMFA